MIAGENPALILMWRMYVASSENWKKNAVALKHDGSASPPSLHFLIAAQQCAIFKIATLRIVAQYCMVL